jgi:hypothetical protein
MQTTKYPIHFNHSPGSDCKSGFSEHKAGFYLLICDVRLFPVQIQVAGLKLLHNYSLSRVSQALFSLFSAGCR